MNKKLEQIINDKSMVKKLYRATEIQKLSDKDDFEDWPMEWKQIYFKSYPRLPQINLEKPKKSFLRKSLSNILLKRHSNRNFSFANISKAELSTLLFFSVGVTKKAKNWDYTSRVYPSAGARYPSELYLVILNSDDLEKGLYHYNVKTHFLELLLKEDLTNQLHRILKQEWVKKTSVLFIITSVISRSEVKYNGRAYRFCFIEAGHIGQNVYLVSAALGLKCCAIGGFIDKDINDLLDFNDNEEYTTYLIAVGK